MINKRMPFISITYTPDEGYIINSTDPYATNKEDRDKSYYGKTRRDAWYEYLNDI